MEKKPKNTTDNEKDEGKIREDAKRSALEKVKQKATIVNIEALAEAEARKAADAHMTESAGKAGFFKKMWKHTFFDEYYRQKEVNKVSEEIKNTGNIYEGRVDSKDKSAHENTMQAISERFISEYEGTLSKGEAKKILDEKEPRTVKTKTEIKNLINDYATSKINEEAFNNGKTRIISGLKNEDLLKGANNYADNLFEIAQNARLAIEHGAKMEELDYDLDIIIGKAKSSLKTEAHLNWVDKGIDKMKKSKVGRFVSPAVLSTAVGLAYSISIGTSKKLLASKAAAYASFGGSVAISSIFAGMNESQRVALERKQHGIEMAEGGNFKPGDKRREQMEKYSYKMENSADLSRNLHDLMFEKDENGKDVAKEVTVDDLDAIFISLSGIEARNNLNNKNKIDLIAYSNIGNVEKERTELTILTARAKVELRKKLEGDLKNGLPEGETFDSYLAKQTEVVEKSLLGGEKGVTARDKAFSKYKAGRIARKMTATAVSGLLIGGAIQEGVAFFRDDVQGVAEGLFNLHEGSHPTIQTPFEHIRGWATGHPSHMGMGHAVLEHLNGHDFKLQEGTSIIHNADGTYNILRGDEIISNHIPLHFDANGNLDSDSLVKLGQDGIIANTTHQVINSTKEVVGTGDNYVNNHLENTHHVARDGWYDNDTPKPIFDQNELKLHWGGASGGTGIDANGNYVFNASHMTSDGSFHNEFSVDAQEKIKSGGLKIILSLTQGTQHQVFEVPIDVHGNAIIDPNSEIGKLFFGTENGHAVFKGRFAEVVQTFGVKDGAEHVKSLATLVGPGNDSVHDIIPTHIDIPITNIDTPLGVEPPYFIPLVARRPLEPVAFGKKEKGREENKNGGNANVSEKVSEETRETKEKTKTINEITQEEYDGMQDDLRMLNRKIQSSAGIIVLEESDFKSEYGKKRYEDLKSIGGGIPISFNKNELQVIGDEMEGILRNSKIVSKEKGRGKENKNIDTVQMEKDNIKSDLEMLNKKIQNSQGIITLDESVFKSEYGKEMYKKLKSVEGGIPVTFNKSELEKIATEMEKSLVGDRKIEKIEEASYEEKIITEDKIQTEEKVVIDRQKEEAPKKDNKIKVEDKKNTTESMESEKSISLDSIKEIIKNRIGKLAKIEKLDLVFKGEKLEINSELNAGLLGGKIKIKGLLENSGDSMGINKNIEIEARGYVKKQITNNLSKLAPEMKKYFEDQYKRSIKSIKIKSGQIVLNFNE